MAADGDMYAQRKVWGFNQLCAAARDHAPVEKLVEIEKKCVRNMLSNGCAVPSLMPSVELAYKLVEASQNGLPLDSVSQTEQQLVAGIKKLERDFVDSLSSSEVAKSVLAVGLSALESGQQFQSMEEFESACCDYLSKFSVNRYGWDSFRANVMKNSGLSLEAYEKMSSDACQLALPEISELFRLAMHSRNGRLSKRSGKGKKSIKHTPEGLNEGLN
jgi:hypothetical protein